MNFTAIAPGSMLRRALRFPLKFIPWNAQVPIIQGPLRGKCWIARSCNHGCWLGSYEIEKQKVFSAAVKRGYSVYDIGANVCLDSLLASNLVGPDGKLFSF